MHLMFLETHHQGTHPFLGEFVVSPIFLGQQNGSWNDYLTHLIIFFTGDFCISRYILGNCPIWIAEKNQLIAIRIQQQNMIFHEAQKKKTVRMAKWPFSSMISSQWGCISLPPCTVLRVKLHIAGPAASQASIELAGNLSTHPPIHPSG